MKSLSRTPVSETRYCTDMLLGSYALHVCTSLWSHTNIRTHRGCTWNGACCKEQKYALGKSFKAQVLGAGSNLQLSAEKPANIRTHRGYTWNGACCKEQKYALGKFFKAQVLGAGSNLQLPVEKPANIRTHRGYTWNGACCKEQKYALGKSFKAQVLGARSNLQLPAEKPANIHLYFCTDLTTLSIVSRSTTQCVPHSKHYSFRYR